MWVAQELQEIGLLVALADDTMRDLYWWLSSNSCDLYLTTPSAAGMLAILGSREPMCQKELLLEDGTRESHFFLATLGEELDRQEIYRNHCEAQAALVQLQ